MFKTVFYGKLKFLFSKLWSRVLRHIWTITWRWRSTTIRILWLLTRRVLLQLTYAALWRSRSIRRGALECRLFDPRWSGLWL